MSYLKTKSFKQPSFLLILLFRGYDISWIERPSQTEQAHQSVAISVKQEVPGRSHRFLHLSSLAPVPYYDQAGAQKKCGLQDFMEQYHGQPSLLTNICGLLTTCPSTTTLNRIVNYRNKIGNYRNLFHFHK